MELWQCSSILRVVILYDKINDLEVEKIYNFASVNSFINFNGYINTYYLILLKE